MLDRELEYFISIAKHQNLSHAAASLYVSQPTLTKYLQRLESEAGVPLFVKNGKKLQMTYAGERYYAYALQFLSLKHSMENEFLEIRKSNLGALRIGMPPFRCSFALPAVLPAFHKKYPNVEITIMEDSSANLDHALMNGQIDLAFYNLSSRIDGLCYQLLEQDEIYAILPKNHPVGRKAILQEGRSIPGIYLEWLADEVFLLQNRHQRQGEYILRELREKHITPKKIQENSNIRAAASLAANGYGVAFLSGALLRHFESVGEFDYFSLLDASYPIHFVAAWREGAYLPSYAHDFIEMMAELSKV